MGEYQPDAQLIERTAHLRLGSLARQLSTLHPIQDHDPLLLFPVQRDCLHGDIFTEQLRGVTITDLSLPSDSHLTN